MNISSQEQSEYITICKECQTNCCYHARPPLTKRRIQIIEDYLEKTNNKLECNAGDYTHPKERDDGYCSLNDYVFKKCIVHEVKPETCVAGPITFDINIDSCRIEWYLKTEKICPLAGLLFKKKLQLYTHLAIARKELFRLISELDLNALQAILEIEEEETFKIGEEELPKDIIEKLMASIP